MVVIEGYALNHMVNVKTFHTNNKKITSDLRQLFAKVGVHFPCISCFGFYYILITDKPLSCRSRDKTEPRHEKTNVLVSDLIRIKPGCTAT